MHRDNPSMKRKVRGISTTESTTFDSGSMAAGGGGRRRKSRESENRRRALGGLRSELDNSRDRNNRWTSAKETSSLSSGGIGSKQSSSELISRRLNFVKAKKIENSSESASIRSSERSMTSDDRSTSDGSSSSSRPRSGRHWPSEFKVASRQLFPEEKIASLAEWSDPSDGAGAGLRNLGNSCFMNATLQCLAYTPAFQNYLSSKHHSSQCRSRGAFCMLCEFHNVMASMLRTSRVVTPNRVFQNLRRIAKSLRPGRQEDAHEFLRALLDSFQTSCLKQHSAEKSKEMRLQETTAVHKIWGGYLRSQVKCCRCGHESNSYEAILDLSLEINDRRCNTVTAALKHFTKREKLDGRNKYRCTDGCKELCKAYKQFSIFEAPNILVLHLKRFEFSFGGGGSRGKINKHIDFPELLDISSLMSHSWVETKGVTYQLIGVLVHYGYSAHSGHYISYIRAPNDGWYCMDDSSVRSASLRKVLSENGYILFYRRLETKTVYKSPRVTPLKSADRMDNNSGSVKVVNNKKKSGGGISGSSSLICEEMGTLSLDASSEETCQKQLTHLKSKLERLRKERSNSNSSISGKKKKNSNSYEAGSRSITITSKKKKSNMQDSSKRDGCDRKRTFAEVSRSSTETIDDSPPMTPFSYLLSSSSSSASSTSSTVGSPILKRAKMISPLVSKEEMEVRQFLEIDDDEPVILSDEPIFAFSNNTRSRLVVPKMDVPPLTTPSASSSCQSSSADDDNRSVISSVTGSLTLSVSPTTSCSDDSTIESTRIPLSASAMSSSIIDPVSSSSSSSASSHHSIHSSCVSKKNKNKRSKKKGGKIVSVKRGSDVFDHLSSETLLSSAAASVSSSKPLFGIEKDLWDDQLDAGEAYTTVRKRGKSHADRWAEMDQTMKVDSRTGRKLNRFQMKQQERGNSSSSSSAQGGRYNSKRLQKKYGKRYNSKQKGEPRQNYYRYNRRVDLN